MTLVLTTADMLSIPGIELSSGGILPATPKVSVIMLAYNHGRFIEQAILGVIEQDCGFEFELLIGDDCSNDDTWEKCTAFQRRYPSRIRLVRSDLNVGMHNNFFRLLSRARGQFIALCEGDDFWISPKKLRVQVDYLEENTDCAFVFHNALVGPDCSPHNTHLFNSVAPRTSDIHSLIEKDWFVPTASIVYRSAHLSPFPVETVTFPSGDLALQILLAANGKPHYFDEPMSVYRQDANSVTSRFKRSPESLLKYGEAFVGMLKILDETLGFKYHKSFAKRANRTVHWMDFIKVRFQRKLDVSTIMGTCLYALGVLTRRGKVA
jgi:glycosyltransferase involved in cell wall biosynthesis